LLTTFRKDNFQHCAYPKYFLSSAQSAKQLGTRKFTAAVQCLPCTYGSMPSLRPNRYFQQCESFTSGLCQFARCS